MKQKQELESVAFQVVPVQVFWFRISWQCYCAAAFGFDGWEVWIFSLLTFIYLDVSSYLLAFYFSHEIGSVYLSRKKVFLSIHHSSQGMDLQFCVQQAVPVTRETGVAF